MESSGNNKRLEGGRKFWLLRMGIVFPFWFALVATFVLEYVNQVLMGKSISEVLDTSLAWKYLGVFTWIAAGGILLYCGVNVFQYLGLVYFNGKKDNKGG